jgi:hypothetical protein
VLGAVAFCLYACASSYVLMRYKLPTLATSIALMPIWFGVSFGLVHVLQ